MFSNIEETPPTLCEKWCPSFRGSLTVYRHISTCLIIQHIVTGQNHLQNFLIVLGLRLLHLSSDANIILQVPAHMLPGAKPLNEEVRSLGQSQELASTIQHRQKSSQHLPSTNLTAIGIRNGLIITHRSPAIRTGHGAPHRRGTMRELRVHGTTRSGHCCCRCRVYLEVSGVVGRELEQSSPLSSLRRTSVGEVV